MVLRRAEVMTENAPLSGLLALPASAPTARTSMLSFGQLKAAGCARIFRKKFTGGRAGRKELLRMLKQFAASDMVTVMRIDRLSPLHL